MTSVKPGNSSVNRADLVRCYARYGKQSLNDMALLFGYAAKPEKKQPKKQQKQEQVIEPAPLASADPPPRPVITSSLANTGAKYYRVVQQINHPPQFTTDNLPLWFDQARQLTNEDLVTTFRLNKKLPLARWSRLWPFLRAVLGEELLLGKPDIAQLVRRTAQGEILREMSRLKRPGWAGNCHIIGDFSSTLMPFWDDFNDLVNHLQSLRGSAGLQALKLIDGDINLSRNWFNLDAAEQPWKFPPVGTPVLILSDLGCLDESSHRRQQWYQLGRRLLNKGLKPVVLMPCPRRLWEAEPVSLFLPKVWDYTHHYPRKIPNKSIFLDASTQQRDYQHGVEPLLTLLAATYLVEPALLRAIRYLLTPDQADVASEAAVWRHAGLLQTADWFLWKTTDNTTQEDGDIVNQRYSRFKQQTKLPRRAAVDLVKAYHHWLSPWVQHEEQCHYAGLLNHPPPAVSLDYFKNVAKTLAQDGESEHLFRWSLGYTQRLQPWVWAQDDELKSVLQAIQFKTQERLASTEHTVQTSFNGLDNIAQGAWISQQSQTPQTWLLTQKQGLINLQQHQKISEQAPNGFLDPWSRLTDVVVAYPLLEYRLFSQVEEQPVIYRTQIGTATAALLSLEKGQQVKLTTDYQTVVIDNFEKPEWAKRLGHDSTGIWVEFEIENITQILRWINSGTFMMGSPEDEVDRENNETLHEVTLTEGYWLADTTCTQALWEAVMGDDPSRSNKGAMYPVENVSWEDVDKFIKKLNTKIPGLDVRLPTEAEWEYACRAGTQTPFSFGENITTEQVNYDGNYPYAGGKKGQNRDKTVEVTALPYNNWGLYQMHGNVWEWCADWYTPYSTEAVTDPTGPKTGEYRVLRGGGWFSLGRNVRSAYRYMDVPSLYRIDFSGFRLARGPKGEKPAGE